jgi:LacI family transcriptional regulator
VQDDAQTNHQRRVTVDDVARHAGVSQATVSQVLNGTRPVSRETQARVRSSIAELGFRPNELARALRQQKSHTVAIVVPNITHVTYPMVARGVSEVLRPRGYQVALYDTDHDPDSETDVVRSIAGRMADGAILFGFPIKPVDAEILDGVGVPFVNGGLDQPSDALWDSVRVDQQAAFSELVGIVRDAGPGPIAYIGGPAEEGSSSPREAGFVAGMRAAGETVDPRLVRSAAYTWEGGRAALSELLRSGPRPRSVICANDMIALGAM